MFERFAAVDPGKDCDVLSHQAGSRRARPTAGALLVVPPTALPANNFRELPKHLNS